MIFCLRGIFFFFFLKKILWKNDPLDPRIDEIWDWKLKCFRIYEFILSIDNHFISVERASNELFKGIRREWGWGGDRGFVKINDGPMRLKEYLWGCKIYVTLYFITAKGKKRNCDIAYINLPSNEIFALETVRVSVASLRPLQVVLDPFYALIDLFYWSIAGTTRSEIVTLRAWNF